MTAHLDCHLQGQGLASALNVQPPAAGRTSRWRHADAPAVVAYPATLKTEQPRTTAQPVACGCLPVPLVLHGNMVGFHGAVRHGGQGKFAAGAPGHRRAAGAPLLDRPVALSPPPAYLCAGHRPGLHKDMCTLTAAFQTVERDMLRQVLGLPCDRFAMTQLG